MVTKEKSFITLTPDLSVIKLYFFGAGKRFQPSLIFVDDPFKVNTLAYFVREKNV